MVIVYIGGGLANKMFQYAFSLAIKKRGFEVVYDTHTFKSEFVHDKATLQEIFPNVEIKERHKAGYLAAGENSKLARIWKRLMPFYVTEYAYHYNENAFTQLRKNCYVESSWQDEKYFESCRDEVRIAFEFPKLVDEQNINIAEALKQENSVAIHIRKGDGYGTWNIFSNTCPQSYYSAAIEYIKKRIKNPKFYVFSDNPEIVKDYLDMVDYKLINWNPSTGKGNYLDMQLMSYAKHNIIANSTYSWWGAWLNANPDKIVIAPNFWFNPKSNMSGVNHIIPNNWIKL